MTYVGYRMEVSVDNLDIRLVRRFHWRRFRFLWRFDVKCDHRGWLPMRWQWDGETYEQMERKLNRAKTATWRKK